MYRLFIDEVGHDNLATADDPNERYLFLMGVCMDFDYALGEFADGLDELKLATFGTKKVVLHRREIIDKRPFPFTALADPAVRCQFDAAILELFRTSKYTALGVLIDKREHLARYEKWHFHPYHYCLTAMLERYVLWLESMSFHAKGDVMCEWRGKQPNRKLEDAYTRLYKFGTDNVSAARFQKRLSTGSLKIQTKTANIAGLQLADLLASPVCRSLICNKNKIPMTAPFGKSVVKILLNGKFRRGGYQQKVMGYGVKLLP